MKALLALVILAVVVAGIEAGPVDILRATSIGAINGAEKAVNAAINVGIEATEKIIARSKPGSDIQKAAKSVQDLLGWASFDTGRVFFQAKQILESIFDQIQGKE